MLKNPVNRKVIGTLVGVVLLVSLSLWGFYIVLGLFGLMAILALYGHIASKRGWGGEGRLTRFLSRPTFEDQIHRSHKTEKEAAEFSNTELDCGDRKFFLRVRQSK
jgi:hypothetical protein